MNTSKLLAGLIGSAFLAGAASAQTTLHYWNFTNVGDADQVGGLATTLVNGPTVGSTYGEAYPGAGNALIGTLGDTSRIEADCWAGANPTYHASPNNSTALDF
ncbi:MAG: hypothetical protein KDB61_16375, partial [Planctomycetes bacterium]|nr:hypothetical protein [Planctomycetota bacterium]